MISLNRLFLRALTLQALMKQPDDEDYPTIAQSLVFDSRVDPINFKEDLIEVPIVAVYTDGDSGRLKDTAAGRGAIERTIDLRIDFAIGSFMRLVNDKETGIQYGVSTTDAEMEMILDIFEAQIWRALQAPGRRVSDLWNELVVRVHNWTTTTDRETENNNRLSSRSIHMQCEIKQDCLPRWFQRGDDPAAKGVDAITKAMPWFDKAVGLLADDAKFSSIVGLLTDVTGGKSVLLPTLTALDSGFHSALDVEPNVLSAMLAGRTPPRGAIHVKQTWNVA